VLRLLDIIESILGALVPGFKWSNWASILAPITQVRISIILAMRILDIAF